MTGREAAAPPADVQGRLTYVLVVGAVVLATAVAVFFEGGPEIAVVPVAVATVVFGLVKARLRSSTLAMLVIMLAVDDRNERQGQFRTPLAFLGDIIHNRLDLATGLPGVSVTGMEVVVVILLAVWTHRRMTGATVDGADRVPSPNVMRGLVIVYVAGALLADAHGLLRGQSLVPWKVRNLLHPILLYVLFEKAFRGPVDNAAIGRLLVGAGVVRSILAFVVQRISIAETGGKYLTATSHGDSVLFATATYLVLIDVLERPDRRRLVRAGLLLPILVVGMMENGRRLVWVMLTLMLGFTYLVVPMRGWKRALTRFVLVALPVLSLYVALGWNRDSRIFLPVRTLRGVTDTSYDHSAYWREVENWNIAMSMRERPLLGVGLGGRYTEHMYNDDITSDYPEYKEWPHNTVLGMLLLLGPFGFATIWALFTAGLFFAFRSYRMAQDEGHRVAALGCAGAIIACHVLAYGDTGAHYPQYKAIMALALVAAGKLAVATGAWPQRRVAGA